MCVSLHVGLGLRRLKLAGSCCWRLTGIVISNVVQPSTVLLLCTLRLPLMFVVRKPLLLLRGMTTRHEVKRRAVGRRRVAAGAWRASGGGPPRIGGVVGVCLVAEQTV